MVTDEQHRAVERQALKVLASIRLIGDLEDDRQEAVRGLRAALAAAPPTAPARRPTDMHPDRETPEQC